MCHQELCFNFLRLFFIVLIKKKQLRQQSIVVLNQSRETVTHMTSCCAC